MKVFEMWIDEGKLTNMLKLKSVVQPSVGGNVSLLNGVYKGIINNNYYYYYYYLL